jgi:hypothetical protein
VVTLRALLSKRLSVIFPAALCLSILGCGTNIASNSPLAGGQLRGKLHGGEQPVSGASIQLYTAGTTGYGSSATPLLASPVVSDASGGFTITGDYTCPSSSSELYLVATGGNPGLAPGTNNPAIALMAALGPCSLHGGQLTLDPNAFITVNEVTTVASVYALAAFMGGDATHVGTSGTNALGLANAFQVVNTLINMKTGGAWTVTPSGNGTVPVAKINSLANILASCVNSDGISLPCGSLFAAATPAGGTAPTDTIQAILNIAMHPGNNVSALFLLGGGFPPFQPTSPFPNDWTLGVHYSGGGMADPRGMAIDSNGDVWIANAGHTSNTASITEFSSNGALLSGPNGYPLTRMSFAFGFAIDPTGNAWVAGSGSNNVIKLSSSGAVLFGANLLTGGGMSSSHSVAVDGAGNAWVTDAAGSSVIKLDSTGTILSGPSGFTAGGMTSPNGIAIDSAGNAWVASGNSVAKLSNNGSVLSGSTGYAVRGDSVAIDAAGDAWLFATLSNAALKLAPDGSLLSPTSGYTTCTSPTSFLTCPGGLPSQLAIDGAGNVWVGMPNRYVQGSAIVSNYGLAELNNSGATISGPTGYTPSAFTTIAVDGSGNVWADGFDQDADADGVTEFIGAGTPVVTPLSVAVKNGTLGTRP